MVCVSGEPSPCASNALVRYDLLAWCSGSTNVGHGCAIAYKAHLCDGAPHRWMTLLRWCAQRALHEMMAAVLSLAASTST